MSEKMLAKKVIYDTVVGESCDQLASQRYNITRPTDVVDVWV
jgi:hypothetical protein